MTTELDLEALLEAMAGSGEFLWPDVPGREGAFRLLLTHVDEFVEYTGTKERPLRIDASGVHR